MVDKAQCRWVGLLLSGFFLVQIACSSTNAARRYSETGIQHYQKKELAKSVESFTSSIEKNENDAGTYLSRGRVFFDKREYEAAEKDFLKAVELEPENPLAWHRLGYTVFELRKYEEAVSALKRAIELKPDYVHAYNNLGRTYTRLEKYDEAVATFFQALELDPDYILAYTNTIHVYVRTNKQEEALRICRLGKNRFDYMREKQKELSTKPPESLATSLPIDNHYGMLFYNCAIVKRGMGKRKEALDDLDRAIQVEPEKSFYKSIRKDFE